eukprot:CAMPEP_0119004916 /NCGR_PEP_ID=MMETSP1176-20130426/1430_1 /TAXON_ID=265551 /ORGANISM="Synedropsis recta cf, Strain CCMP1620" /LENGTH=322 /DNA_ID=CAMNT_0006956677 /DNA_START=15 /DNA_END=983 /DNA_ORIENTATION=+
MAPPIPPVPPSPPTETPSIHPYQSTFSEEEIHDILGAMNGQGEQEEGTEEAANSTFPGSEIPVESRAKARSERKRSREKQRREDVNKQFADLSQLLRTIETEDLDDDARMPLATTSPTNRVDLIARTICILERTHKLNKTRKEEVADLKKQVKDSNKMAEDTAARLKEATLYQQSGPSKPMMMMVPMMVNPESMGGAGGAAGFQMPPQAFMPQQQQMMMMPQQMAGAPTPPNSNAPPPPPPPNMMQQQQPMMQPMMQQHMPQMPMPHQMQSFSTMMYAQPQAPMAASAPSAAPNTGQQPGQQQPGKPGAANVGGGGNLAHCA